MKISIPQPCHENWENMLPSERGRFCDACQKQVIDFTKTTDRELKKVMEGETSVCGRFLSSQLDRELQIPNQRRCIPALASFLFAGILSLTAQSSHAQKKVHATHTVKKAPIHLKLLMITGNVKDIQGALPFVMVNIKHSTRATQTDDYGNFAIQAAIGETLEFSFPGYETAEIKISGTTEINMVLEEDKCISTSLGVPGYTVTRHTVVAGGAVMITSTSVQKRRTFLGRIFHGIGNLFH